MWQHAYIFGSDLQPAVTTWHVYVLFFALL